MDDRRVIISGALLDNKLESLKQVKLDLSSWTVFYLDEATNEKWVKEYPHSEMHGGGAPILIQIEKFPWE